MEKRNDAQKGKRKKIVYAAKCRGTIELLRRVVKDLGWEFSNLRKCHECDYVWFGPPVSRNLVVDDDFLALRKYPKHRSSKIPGMSKAMAKSVFAQALMVLEKFVGYSFDFSPRTFIYPGDTSRILDYVTKSPTASCPYVIIKPSVGSQGKDIIIEHKDEAMKVLSRLSSYKAEEGKLPVTTPKAKNLAVAKRLQRYQDLARTIEESKSPSWDASFKHEYVVQHYIDNPYLVDAYKFDIRLYVVVAGLSPLRAYLYKDGLVRLCTEPYVEPTKANVCKSAMHLTNYSLQKEQPNFEVSNELGEGTKRALSSFLSNFYVQQQQDKNFDQSKFWSECAHIICTSLVALKPQLAYEYKKSLKLPRTKKDLHDVDFRCFQILGFDIMMDESQKLHLIEGNCAPSLNIYTKSTANSGSKYLCTTSPHTF